MPSCQVYIRGSKERIETLGDTICHLRDAVAAFVDTAEPRFQQQAQAIRLFGNDSAIELNDAFPLTMTIEYTYTALEVFTTVPTDLFRTVKMDQIHPAVDSDPENNNRFTRVSPMFCAALAPLESIDLPFYMKGGRIMVRGASLICHDGAVVANFAPSDEVTETEPMNTLMKIPLDDVKFQNTYDGGTEFGILHTSMLNVSYGLAIVPLFADPKESFGSGSRKKRHFYWRYVIRRGTDLSTLGVSLVFDNASKNHFTLIPNQRNNLSCTKWGVRLPNPRQMHVFQQMNLYRRDPAQPTPPVDTQPEHIFPVRYQKDYVTYPWVAQKFELHDFVMRASGLVQSVELYDDEDRQNIAQAAEIMYDRGANSYEMYDALAILSSFAFDIKKVSFYDLGILLNGMTEFDYYSEDDVGVHEQSVVSSAVKAINYFFEMCSQGLMEEA
jgi:hypothetical protein